MARKEIIVFTDDVTGEEAADVETVLLVADGVAYEVDMSAKTREAYTAAIEPYRTAGRRIGRATAGASILRPTFGGQSAAPTRTVADKEQNRAVREWWSRNQGRGGLPPVVERGRIPQSILDAFQDHGGRTIEEAPDVKPSQEPRKAGTVGAEVTVRAVQSPAFSAAEPVEEVNAETAAPTAKKAARKTVTERNADQQNAEAGTSFAEAARTRAAKKSTAATSEKSPRKRAATASVKSAEAVSGGKPQTAAKRTGRRAAAS